MTISKTVDVDVDVEIDIADVLKFIEHYAGTRELNRIRICLDKKEKLSTIVEPARLQLLVQCRAYGEYWKTLELLEQNNLEVQL